MQPLRALRRAGHPGRPEGRGLPLRHARRRHRVGVRRHRAAEQGRDPGEGRREGGRHRRGLRDGPHEPGRAPQAGRGHLERGERRGRRGHGRELRQVQPHLHDGVLGRPRQYQADPPAGWYARPHVRPEGRDHRPAHQGELPRRPVGPGILHFHAWRPQGPGRHGAAYRRLGVPDPSSGGRGPGRHHPRDRLRHQRRRAVPHLQREGRPRREPDRPLPAGRRRGSRRYRGGGRRRVRHVHGPGEGARGRGHHRGGHPHGHDLPCRPRRVPEVLRLGPGHVASGQHRHGGGHHCRPVHRRAGHAADHAHVPHRRCCGRGHHPRSPARPRAVRGPQAQGPGGARRDLGHHADRGRQAVQDHHDPRPGGQLPRVRGERPCPAAAGRERRLRGQGGPAAPPRAR